MIVFLILFGAAALLTVFTTYWTPISEAIAVPLGTLDNALEPFLSKIPDSPLVPVIAAVVLFVLWILTVAVDIDHGPLSESAVESTLKLLYAWIWSAFSLGVIVAVSGNPLGDWSPFMKFLFAIDSPMTLTNFSEWGGFPQVMLLLTLAGGLLAAVIFTLFQGIRSLLFVLESIGLCGLLGYLFMYYQLVSLEFISSIVGSFIPGLLSAVLTLVNVVLMIQFFAGVVVFFMSPAAIAEYAKEKREQEREEIYNRRTSSRSPRTDHSSASASVPTYVTDEDGNTYPVEKRGDFIYIRTPGGEISTKWEYVKNQPYFDLQGERYYPH